MGILQFLMDIVFHHFESIDSTNKWAKDHAKDLDPHKLHCISADKQTAGYGRFGRKWICHVGNLFVSLFFHIQKEEALLPNMAQIFALSCAKALQKQGIQLLIKWPNDLIFQGKKLAGILVETVRFDNSHAVVLGLGMNVNSPIESDLPTISLKELSGKNWKIKNLMQSLLMQFLQDFLLFKKEGLATFKKEFAPFLIQGPKNWYRGSQ